MRIGARTALFVLALSLARPAAAQPAPAGEALAEARERYERGIDLFGQGDYGGALAEFKRAREIAPYAVILYNLGLTYAALGRPVEAAETMAQVVANPGSLSADRLDRARAVLREQKARIAEIQVETSVPGATVDVDGVEVSKTPLAKPLQVKGGPHRIGAVLPGFAPARKEVDAAAGSRTSVQLELVPTDRSLGHLTVKTKLPAAEVAIDGQVVGMSPLRSSLAVLPGSHRVELRRPGYVTAKTELVVGEGATGEVALDPEEDPAAIRTEGGTLVLTISEPQALVIVDGRSRGVYLGAIPLAAGPHRLRVERGGFLASERDVDVPARKETNVRVELEPTPETRVAYVGKAKAYRTWGLVGVGVGALLAGSGIGFLIYNAGQKSASEDDLAAFKAKTQNGGYCDNPSGNLALHKEYCETEDAKLRDHDSAVRSRDKIGWIGLGVGAAALGTGIVVLFLGEDPGRYDRRPSGDTLGRLRLRPVAAIGPGSSQVGVGGRF